jgi:hypothetical protein
MRPSHRPRRAATFYKGLEIGLSRLLSSANFIFRVERGEPDPSRPVPSDSILFACRADQLLLWTRRPTLELLDAAANGAHAHSGGVGRQVGTG